MPAEPVVLLAQAKKGPAQMAALIPSTLMGTIAVKEKRIVFLLDHSGSMAGVPLEQAKMAIGACLSALNAKDSFGIVAFSDDAKGMSDGLLKANEANRSTADRFLKGIQHDGGTELLGGFLKAGAVLEGKGGEIFLVTDGQVSETDTLIVKARAQEIRIHTLGIGSAAQDRFLEQLARETGGISRCVTTTERVDLAALDLFASCTTPVAEGFSASVLLPGKTKVAVEPEARRIVFDGVPTLVFAEMKPVSGAMLELTWTKPEDGRQERDSVPLRNHELHSSIALPRNCPLRPRCTSETLRGTRHRNEETSAS
jgi:Ca-activated chloride channel family protein